MAAATTWTIIAQGKPRTFGSGQRAWRVRLYAEPTGKRYRVRFKAPTGDGEEWDWVLRRANSETEARQLFAKPRRAPTCALHRRLTRWPRST
jgi:hypothetical protein